MSFLETIACNSPEELTDWLGAKIGELLNLHANHMANTLPLMDEVPLHPFLATGLAKAILDDVDGELSSPGVEPEYDLEEFVKLARA